jgi:hypothetical protein
MPSITRLKSDYKGGIKVYAVGKPTLYNVSTAVVRDVIGEEIMSQILDIRYAEIGVTVDESAWRYMEKNQI